MKTFTTFILTLAFSICLIGCGTSTNTTIEKHNIVETETEATEVMDEVADKEIDFCYISYDINSNDEFFYFIHKENKSYKLDIDIPKVPKLIDYNNKCALMAAGSYIFLFDFETEKCELITSDALDYSVSDNTLLYTDWNHNEFKCTWDESCDSVKTGHKVPFYRNEIFELTVNQDFQEEFSQLQFELYAGEITFETKCAEYTILPWGNVYNNYTGEIIANIHLPKAYVINNNLMYADCYSCWLIEDSNIALYCLGEIVQNYTLPEGNWRFVESYLDLPAEHTEETLDSNDNGIVTCDELRVAINSYNILLYNESTNELYTIKDDTISKVAEDVKNFTESYNQIYWIDSEFNCYELSWYVDSDSILIGTNVVGVCTSIEEISGYVVKPGDPRCNEEIGGFSLCTYIGNDWLNQEKTSAAAFME